MTANKTIRAKHLKEGSTLTELGYEYVIASVSIEGRTVRVKMQREGMLVSRHFRAFEQVAIVS